MKSSLDLRQLKNKILKLLTKRDHSVYEMETKIKRYYEFSSDDFQGALTYVKNLGYLPNEEVMADRLIQKWRTEGRGRNYIFSKLKSKGLRSSKLKDNEDEKAAALIFLDKKLQGRKIKNLDFSEKQKIMRQMTSRGFSISLVRDLFQ